METDTLSEMWAWLVSRARAMTRNAEYADDIAQEALIAIWRECQKAAADGREVNLSYLKQRGRWTLLNGLTSVGRRIEEPTGDEELSTAMPPVFQPEPDRYSTEVDAAVRQLTTRQQQYVRLRFWEGWETTQLHARGYGRNLWYDPKNGARARLKESLAYLRNGNG